MNAKDLAEKLMEHPDADVMVMTSSEIDVVTYDDPQNVFYIYLY